MDVKYKDSFFKSLDRLIWNESWLGKTVSFFKRDLWRFLKNLWDFRKEIYAYRPWDFHYILGMLRKSIELQANYVEEKGFEIAETRLKKVEKMRRAIEIIEWHESGDFLDLAEKELGYELKSGEWNFTKVERGDGEEPFVNPLTNQEEDLFELDLGLSEEDEAANKKIYDLSRKIEIDSFNELIDILKGQDWNEFKSSLSEKDKDNLEKQFAEYDDWFDGSGLMSWWD